LIALAGIALWNQNKQRPAARLFGIGALGSLVLALAGLLHETAARLGTVHFLMPAYLWATLPLTHTLCTVARCLQYRLGALSCAVLLGSLVALTAGLAPTALLTRVAGSFLSVEPLEVGLAPERQAWIEAILAHTTPTARILWEDRVGTTNSSSWTALLPLLTQRAFVGGLDPDAGVEHAFISLADRKLAGRQLDDWSDADLESFCGRYNIGWVICRTDAAQARFRVWSKAKEVPLGTATGHGRLYAIDRSHSFALVGQARLLRADSRSIALADLVPENGKIVLSFHAQPGLEPSSNRVRIEREPDALDPIPFIRLAMTGPVTHLTLAWKNR
jgi:hypothetical protein